MALQESRVFSDYLDFDRVSRLIENDIKYLINVYRLIITMDLKIHQIIDLVKKTNRVVARSTLYLNKIIYVCRFKNKGIIDKHVKEVQNDIHLDLLSSKIFKGQNDVLDHKIQLIQNINENDIMKYHCIFPELDQIRFSIKNFLMERDSIAVDITKKIDEIHYKIRQEAEAKLIK